MPSVIIITGAGRGIGAATARRAARAGHAVCVNYLSDRRTAKAVAATIEKDGGNALVVQADTAVEADVRRLFDTAQAHWGRIDGLVNNAGITGRIGRFAEAETATLERVLAVNVLGPMLCAREAVRRFSTARGGRGGVIVNLSSIAATLGAPDEYVHYAASKAAIDAFTLGIARETAREGIRVNAVAPGSTLTGIHAAAGEPGRPARVAPRIPMGRLADPDEIAEAVVWLLSDAASYVTGAILRVSGGL